MLLLLIVVGFLLLGSLSDIVLVDSFEITSLLFLIPSCSEWLDLKFPNSLRPLPNLFPFIILDFSLCLSPQAVPLPLKQLGANDMLLEVENLSKSISSSFMSKKSAKSLKALEYLHSPFCFYRSSFSILM